MQSPVTAVPLRDLPSLYGTGAPRARGAYIEARSQALIDESFPAFPPGSTSVTASSASIIVSTPPPCTTDSIPWIISQHTVVSRGEVAEARLLCVRCWLFTRLESLSILRTYYTAAGPFVTSPCQRMYALSSADATRAHPGSFVYWMNVRKKS